MNTSSKFYAERADEAAREAGKATLTNVRDRALRSEAVFRGMANRAAAMEEKKATKLAEAEAAADSDAQAAAQVDAHASAQSPAQTTGPDQWT